MKALAEQDEVLTHPPGFRIARVWLAVMVAMAFAIAGRAAVRFDVFVGHDQIVPEASWFPITFEVLNDGPPFTATVEITPGSFDTSHTRMMEVELPTGTLKRFTIPAFSAGRFFNNWNARLLDERGKVRAEQTNLRVRQTTPWQLPMFAAVSRTRTLPTVPRIQSNQPDLQPVVARFLPEVFPDNPITLEGLDTIYLQAERALDLKVNQVNALLAWLHAGGHLIVGVEQVLHVNATEWLKRILPCDLTTIQMETNHAALHEFLVSERRRDGGAYNFRGTAAPARSKRRGTTAVEAGNPYEKLKADPKFEGAPMQVATGVLRDGEILIGSAEAPLAIIANRGRGQLTVLTFGPELEPFVSWTNRPYFWAKMMDMPPELLIREQSPQYSGHSIDGVFGAMIDSKQVRKLPVAWLLVLLVGYLVVIGPLDRYWLNKINRQMLTWITFPIYVALFSGLIYLIGYKLRAGESEWNELHVVDVIPVGEQADLRGRSYASIYSPVNARYHLTSEQTFSTLRGEFMSYGRQEASRATIAQNGNNFDAEISVPVWTSQLYVSDWWRRSGTPLKLTVKGQADEYVVTVDNQLDRKLKHCKVVIGEKVFDVAELAPKQSRVVTLGRVEHETLSSFLHRYGGTFAAAVNQRQHAFGDNEATIFDIPHGTMAACFVSKLAPGEQFGHQQFVGPSGMDLTPLLERGFVVLLAWAEDYSPVKPINKFSARRSHKDTLFRVAAPVKD